MKKYTEMNHEELLALKKELDKEFEEIKAQGLALDMSRGKPSNNALLILLSASGCLAIASVAAAVALPIPIPAPIPVNTATPAPIATNNADDIITTLLFFSL